MKKNKSLKSLIIILLIIYVSAYYVSNSGYYEYYMQKKTILTNDRIKEFEEDVKNGKDIDIKNYLDYEKKDYSNRVSNLMYEFSDKGVSVTRKIIKFLFKKLSYLVED